MRFAWLPFAGWLLTGLAMAAFLWPGLSLAGVSKPGNQERNMSPLQSTTHTPGVEVPPMDTVVPAKTETATFALG
jgi:hypothetical protein